MSTSQSTAPPGHPLAEDLHVQVLRADVEDERGQQVAGDVDTAVARHRDHDPMPEPGEGRRQRGGDVGEAAGLGVRQHFRRDHQDRQAIRRLAGNNRRRAVQRRLRRQYRLEFDGQTGRGIGRGRGERFDRLPPRGGRPCPLGGGRAR